MNDTDKAYFAAFVDGEGCITVQRRLRSKTKFPVYDLTVIISNNVSAPLYDAKKLWGGQVYAQKKKHCWHYAYRVSDQRAAALLTDIRSYLRIKGTQADIALAYIKNAGNGRRNCLGTILWKENKYRELRDAKALGVKMIPGKVYTPKKGTPKTKNSIEPWLASAQVRFVSDGCGCSDDPSICLNRDIID